MIKFGAKFNSGRSDFPSTHQPDKSRSLTSHGKSNFRRIFQNGEQMVITVFLISFGCIIALPHITEAASSCQNGLQGYCVELDYLAQAGSKIPGLEFLGNVPDNPAELFSKLYTFGVGLVALIAFIMLTMGGVMYIFAGDKDPTKAKTMMRNALFGLLTVLFSWLSLNIINPDLVKGININLPSIQSGPGGTSQNIGRTSFSLVEDQGGPLRSTQPLKLLGE